MPSHPSDPYSEVSSTRPRVPLHSQLACVRQQWFHPLDPKRDHYCLGGRWPVHDDGLFGFQRGPVWVGISQELDEGASSLRCETESQKHLRTDQA